MAGGKMDLWAVACVLVKVAGTIWATSSMVADWRRFATTPFRTNRPIIVGTLVIAAQHLFILFAISVFWFAGKPFH